MKHILIGLVAPKQSGKDTAADYLCSNYNFKKYNFADPLKEAMGKIFGFTHEQLYGNEKEKIDPFWGITPREILQKMGTEIFQYEVPKVIKELEPVGRSFWVKCFEKWYTNELENSKKENTNKIINVFEVPMKVLPYSFLNECKSNTKVVISDIRFLHESNKVKELGGTLIKINRDTEHNEYSEHPSELEYKEIKCDYEINNNGNIGELYKEIDLIMQNFKN